MYEQEFTILFFLLCIRTCLLSCIPSPTQCGCSVIKPSVTESKIVGGIIARNHSWPWMVSLRRLSSGASSASSGFSFCGGTLIRSRYVLTAAHCFHNVVPSNLSQIFAAVGVLYRNDTDMVHFKIQSFTIHSQYVHGLYLNDIAILKLEKSVNFTDPNVGFICMPPIDTTVYPYENTVGTAIGWGYIKEGGPSSNSLQEVQLPVMPSTNNYCSSVINDNITQFCAGYAEGGKDTCQGDSGGPFMIYDTVSDTWNIAGITSYGTGCAEPKKAGIYTRVSMFTAWIHSLTNDDYLISQATMELSSFLVLSCLFCINVIFLH